MAGTVPDPARPVVVAGEHPKEHKVAIAEEVIMMPLLFIAIVLIDGSVDVREQSIEEGIVLLTEVLQFGHAWGEVEVLLRLVLL